VEAWFVDELGFVTEGASSNAWIVDAEGRLRTRDTNANILRGITRRTLMDVIQGEGLEVDERPFTPADALAAKEAFITGAGSLVLPVVAVDGKPVGEGRPGPLATKLRRLYIERAKATSL
jgi:D-alanine transaminase